MTDKQTVRLFVAVELPQEVKMELHAIQRWLKQQDLFSGTYTTSDQAHITLHFIGSVTPEQQAHICQLLEAITLNQMEAQLSGLDYFARNGFIKVLYVDVACPELEALARTIQTTLQPALGQPDLPQPDEATEQFVNHVTLARVKQVSDRDALLAALARYPVPPIRFTVDSFVLKASTLTPTGAEHSIIAVYKT